MQPQGGSITVGQPKHTELAAIDTATEEAFNALIAHAKQGGLELKTVDGLMYLPDQSATVRFQQACRGVIDDLRVKPSAEPQPPQE